MLLLSSISHCFSQTKSDSLIYKNAVKFDLVPLYDDLFDSKMQARIGIEYERNLTKKSALDCYLDVGLYNNYEFIKYYNFFTPPAMYTLNQKVSISGFHLIPAYHYYLFISKKESERSLFAGSLMDFSYYHKSLRTKNTATSETSNEQYNQSKLGVGLSVGCNFFVSKHFFIELKTSVVTKLFNKLSVDGKNEMMSLDAQWTSANYKFWWITNFKIGYAF